MEDTVNRKLTGGNRDARGRFVKGNKSGGRPKQAPEFKDLARTKSLEALVRVVNILENPLSEAKDVLAAAKLIIEYAYGKPAQQLTADVRQQVAGDFVLEVISQDEA